METVCYFRRSDTQDKYMYMQVFRDNQHLPITMLKQDIYLSLKAYIKNVLNYEDMFSHFCIEFLVKYFK